MCAFENETAGRGSSESEADRTVRLDVGVMWIRPSYGFCPRRRKDDVDVPWRVVGASVRGADGRVGGIRFVRAAELGERGEDAFGRRTGRRYDVVLRRAGFLFDGSRV